MNALKKLAGQTAVYGLSSVLGRVLGYLLVPLYTRVFLPGEYGTVSVFYAYAAFLMVVLSYGMETAFFRYYDNKAQDRDRIYGTTLLSLVGTSLVFVIVMIVMAQPIAKLIGFPKHSEYVIWFALMIVFDAICTIPFARLRAINRPKMFAFIKIFTIGVCFLLNIIFLYVLPYLYNHNILMSVVSFIYNPDVGVGYIFIANLISSGLTLLLLLVLLPHRKLSFDFAIWKRMLKYALPLLIFGLAGNINETFDRILLPNLLPPDIAMSQVGIYSACYKI